MEKRESCSMDIQKAERADACNIEGKKKFDTKALEGAESSKDTSYMTRIQMSETILIGSLLALAGGVHIHLQRRCFCKCADRKHRAVQHASVSDGVGACADISDPDHCLCGRDNDDRDGAAPTENSRLFALETGHAFA